MVRHDDTRAGGRRKSRPPSDPKMQILDLIFKVEESAARFRISRSRRPTPRSDRACGGRAVRLRQGGHQADAQNALKQVADIVRGKSQGHGAHRRPHRFKRFGCHTTRSSLIGGQTRSGTGSSRTRGSRTCGSAPGFGARKPAVPNTKPDGSDDPEGRQKNRRVEIVIGKK